MATVLGTSASGVEALGSGGFSGNTRTMFSLSGGAGLGRGFFIFITLSLSRVRVPGGFGCGCRGDLVGASEPLQVVSSVLVEGKRFSLELRGVTSGVSYGCALVCCWPSSELNILDTLDLDVGDILCGASYTLQGYTLSDVLVVKEVFNSVGTCIFLLDGL